MTYLLSTNTNKNVNGFDFMTYLYSLDSARDLCALTCASKDLKRITHQYIADRYVESVSPLSGDFCSKILMELNIQNFSVRIVFKLSKLFNIVGQDKKGFERFCSYLPDRKKSTGLNFNSFIIKMLFEDNRWDIIKYLASQYTKNYINNAEAKKFYLTLAMSAILKTLKE